MTHCRSLNVVCSSRAMSGSATFTIVTSTSSMHAPAQTATSGHHLRISRSFLASCRLLGLPVRRTARPSRDRFPGQSRGPSGFPTHDALSAAAYDSHCHQMRRLSTRASVLTVESTTVDDLDRQLAQCLGVGGGAPSSAIPGVRGVPDQTVARRYRRLRSAGALRVVGLRYPKSAGYANWFLRLRCVPGSGEAIAAALAQRPDTAWVQLLSGDTEVLCSLRGDGSDGTEAPLTRLPRSGRIVAVTAYSRLHMFTGS